MLADLQLRDHGSYGSLMMKGIRTVSEPLPGSQPPFRDMYCDRSDSYIITKLSLDGDSNNSLVSDCRLELYEHVAGSITRSGERDLCPKNTRIVA